MVNWIEFKPIREQKGSGDVADVVSHCSNPSTYAFPDSDVTTTHEVTHCINADLRNGAIRYHVAPYARCGVGVCGLPEPIYSDKYQLSKFNCFYVLKDRAIKLAEPSTRKSDCAKYVPKTLQYYRFKTYITGQTAWDDTPLYVFDEYIAYVNGADNLLEQIRENRLHEDGADYLFAPLEFISYGVATLMAADKANSLSQELIEFVKWIVAKSMYMYYIGKDKAPWKDMEECVDKLLTGNECSDIRSFLKDKMDYQLPTTAIDPDITPLDVNV